MAADRVNREPSGWAVGWTMFAATMMFLIGTFHFMAGLIGILEDDFYVKGREYVFQFDSTTWGWLHLILGLVILFGGAGLFRGAVWARTVGVIMALSSAIAGFAWMPWYPIWGILFVVASISVIWALTAHGRDITRTD